MPGLHPELAPVSEAVTNNIRVEVLSRYSPENSRSIEGAWVFEYTVRITNLGSEPVQLLSRHWIITDALERSEEVRGPGVVGQQPVLAPGESFKYSSWCPAQNPHRRHARFLPDGRRGWQPVRCRHRPLRPKGPVHRSISGRVSRLSRVP